MRVRIETKNSAEASHRGGFFVFYFTAQMVTKVGRARMGYLANFA
ncbi:hypothetical protein YPPY13_2834 [Yersinia pestis PY-13]|uniref:Uncharacterized protein n=1 Tax=Yersinia pestis PY-08 TaxID=992134 RepID=A0AB72ZI40_YERPE|nr:hypothetical protein YpMG051020_2642 [Yersinia pestis biovar Orientalis str. MG05-1020]EIQ88821.1 hypothetical protein YPPY02_2789 [Yersinia pestis PY-02]EIQ89605.1 hypothetical protein YPPY03_2845 [Yersinia pestis PY-03]EIR01182.1 hypothetical protein YPPY04_2809 [Yersinia pestis PY-04]EIR02530.1 hypothetical protein YPPY05_2787 [Yersinia pestis PY-05]EIR05684.1 hypothetical protein YPPY06_2841 [Yersinia pestis PY-06]EIR16590.1 hypothetical protein YPPY07_2709 [Yersinia pestis PY-07]EIR1